MRVEVADWLPTHLLLLSLPLPYRWLRGLHEAMCDVVCHHPGDRQPFLVAAWCP